MKFRMLICLLLLTLVCSGAYAQEASSFENPEYSPDFIAQQEGMLARVEELFPRVLYQQTFDVPTKPNVSKPQDGYFLYDMITRAGKKEFMLNAYKPIVENKGWGENYFNITGSYSDFYAAIDGQLIERDDSGQGYLWFQYTDGSIVGETNRSSVTMSFPLNIVKYSPGQFDREYTTLYTLSGFDRDYQTHRFEIIRLNGYVSFFIDKHFTAGFEDSLSGRFYPSYGVGLRSDGTYVTGAFDNFMIRTQIN